jgi:hypothetical protein
MTNQEKIQLLREKLKGLREAGFAEEEAIEKSATNSVAILREGVKGNLSDIEKFVLLGIYDQWKDHGKEKGFPLTKESVNAEDLEEYVDATVSNLTEAACESLKKKKYLVVDPIAYGLAYTMTPAGAQAVKALSRKYEYS